MFLSPSQEPNDLEKLYESFEELQKQFEAQLHRGGIDRAQLDAWLADPSQFAGSDWRLIEQEIAQFRETLELACFGHCSEELKARRKQMSEQRNHWIR